MNSSAGLSPRPRPSLLVKPALLREANDFVAAHHRHNVATPKNGGRFAVAAVADGEIVGMAIGARPVARKLDDGLTLEVVRLCTLPNAPLGTCSKLYRALWRAWRALGGRCVITYTLETECGASLRGAGFVAVAKVPPQQWSRIGRPRKDQRVYRFEKTRWQLDCK